MRFSITAVALLSLPQYGTCWSDLGHRTVAYLAQKYLTKGAAEYIGGILAGFEFSDAATWADTIKRGPHSRPWTKEWHYIDALDAPPLECNVNYNRDCFNSEHREGCIISAITNQTSLFLDPNAEDIVRKEALMFIFHFIGDLHQPLHIENAFRGGNNISVCFRRACAHNKLHAVWDKYIPHKICGISNAANNDEERAAAAEWANKLYAANQKRRVKKQCADVTNPQKCTMDWATETNKYICSYVLNVGGLTDLEEIKDWFADRDLSTDYYEGAVPIVDYLIGMAGIRLGGYLNSLSTAAQGAAVLEEQSPLGDFEL